MARDLFEQDRDSAAFLESAEARLDGVPLRRLMLEGPAEDLQATEHAQPAILAQSLALLRRLQSEGIRPGAVAGHSMGEFGGLVAAGGLEPIDAVAAVHARGLAMVLAGAPDSGMAAVLGLPDGAVDRVLREAGANQVVAANFNAPGQVVISGTVAGLARVKPHLERAGARRIVPLEVSAGFHSPLMAAAAQAFRSAWDRTPLRPLALPQVFNADGEVHQDPAEVRELMVRQLTGPVRWTACVHRLWALGARTFVEVGPKRTLTALVRKIQPEAITHNVEDLRSLGAFLETARA